MGLLDLLKATENATLKEQVNKLTLELSKTKDSLSTEQLNAINVEKYIEELELKKSLLEEDLKNINQEINTKKSNLIILDDEILMQDFGLYRPIYDFANSDMYKEKLSYVRQEQKNMIKNKTSVTFFDKWTVNGSVSEGRKMTKDNIKQVLRTFNVECENAIDRVKFNNFETMEKRIQKAYDSLNKLNETNKISLTNTFLNLKIEELHLAYEYQLKKQEEKEERKRIREELKEQEKLQKEIEKAKQNIDKDIKHYSNALEFLNEQLKDETLPEDHRKALLDKKIEIELKLKELDENLKDIDYRQANQKAGYVYVISNIGAFGENVYKIGMTRRLNPEDRVDELSDASVPFKFDIHAMIFSEDAPTLENALHKAFDDKKINMVNRRKEFFNITLQEIEEAIKQNFDKTVEFKRIPDAEQYRESKKMKENL